MKEMCKQTNRRQTLSALCGIVPSVILIFLLAGGALALLHAKIALPESDTSAAAFMLLGLCRRNRSKKNTFKWLNTTQFTCTLNDNAFKMLTVIYLFSVLKSSLTTTLTLASVLLVLPFLLFSNLAGVLTDRFSKRTIVIAAKWAELAILLAAYPALLSGLAWPVYTILFLLAAQSAFIGPAKRGIVPELVASEELSRANGFMTGATYIAIILGLFLPSLATTLWNASPFSILTGCIAISLAGLFSAFRIAPTPAAGQTRRTSIRIVSDATRSLRTLCTHVWLKRAVYGSIAFSGITALFQQNIVVYTREVAALPVEASGFLFLLVAIGIATGALLSGKFSKHTIELGLIPLGTAGLAASIICLSLAHSTVAVVALLIFSGVAAGICIVPLDAYVQQEVPADRRGEIFGAISFLSFSAMVAASGTFYLLFNVLHADARICMLITGIAGIIASIWALVRLPDYAIRFLISRLTCFLYRINVTGLENLPREGGALILSNHIAYGDATIIQSATQRPVRYLMSRDVFKSWHLFRPIFKLTGAIPIHTSDGPRKLAASLGDAREALRQGALISIFPEGELSKNGNMQTFHKGFEKILKGTNVPVIPVHLDNLWGSIFSFRHGNPGFKWPRRFPYPVTVRFGKALPSTVTACEVRQAIAELGAETATEKSQRAGNTLAHRLLKSARKNWKQTLVSDTFGHHLTGGQLLTGAAVLNRRLGTHLTGEKNIGILLPQSVAGALTNAALTLHGKTVVNLNWTVPSEALQFAVQQSRIRHIITSRKFAAKVKLPELPVELLYIEELSENVTLREKFAARLQARFAPVNAWADENVPQPTDPACIIFSSGSTGTPKGIVLSHANLLSNLDSLQQVISFNRQDSICGILPLFHSFGFLGTLWWPLLTGTRTVYHANPLQPSQIVRLIRDEQLTTLLTTPTLLQTYLRKADKADFVSLRNVITGGEKLPESLADSFEEKFGIRPLQGYGTTELSPVATLSLRNRKINQFVSIGCKPSSAGHPLPNIAARIVDPETGTAKPVGENGLLLIKGPNVMQGYLNAPEKTAEVIQHGWYNTGDIARMDEEGFIYLTDRLARFSKIGGEMVPHGAVEEILQNACGTDTPCVAVVTVSDTTKGEQLAVCYTPEAGDADILHAILKNSRVPNLWVPRRDLFFPVSEFPMLGTGKLDLCALRELAGNH
jgi:acyl-[acyl-carrier-protein]-phospholipid O-acyltransferase/long-chain-fatty-acid--[acyl-carrier-protein] ligase